MCRAPISVIGWIISYLHWINGSDDSVPGRCPNPRYGILCDVRLRHAAHSGASSYHPRKTAGHDCDLDDLDSSAERCMYAIRLLRFILTALPTRATSMPESSALQILQSVVLPSEVRRWASS